MNNLPDIVGFALIPISVAAILYLAVVVPRRRNRSTEVTTVADFFVADLYTIVRNPKDGKPLKYISVPSDGAVYILTPALVPERPGYVRVVAEIQPEAISAIMKRLESVVIGGEQVALTKTTRAPGSYFTFLKVE